jgi:hypothetical protein
MPACPDRNELLLLDVYKELDAVARPELDEHLKACVDCRVEKERLEAILGLVKEKMVSSPLTMMESAALVKGVQRKLASPHPTRRWQEFFKAKRALWLPAAATACLLVLLTTFVGYERFDMAERPVVPKLDISKQLPENDVEIIQNLDLLKNFNTLEKLSQVVNDSPGRNSIETDDQGAQGEIPYGITERTA